jgi:hypothetical protein
VIKGGKTERVVITLLALLDLPIDWFPMSVILSSSKHRRSPPWMPNTGDFRILTQVDCMVRNKECSDSSSIDDTFNMSFLIRKGGRKEGRKKERKKKGMVVRCRIHRRKAIWVPGAYVRTLRAIEEEMGHDRASQNLPKRLPPA